MMYKAWSSTEEVPYCFSRSSVKFEGHTAKKNRWFWPKLGVTGQFELTNGYEMIHKALNRIEEVPYFFSRSSVKFQGNTGWKIDDLNPIWVRLLGRSQLSNPSDLPCCILSLISLKFVPECPIDNNSALVQIMVWHRTDDKPLSVCLTNVDPVLWRIYAALGGGGWVYI